MDEQKQDPKYAPMYAKVLFLLVIILGFLGGYMLLIQ